MVLRMLRSSFSILPSAVLALGLVTSGCSERQLKAPPSAPAVADAAADAGQPVMDAGTSEAAAPAQRRGRWVSSLVTLDGVDTEVSWSDGDTFRIQSGPHAKVSARLHGYNTLEDYGPVHRWGEWTPQELLGLAKAAGNRARQGKWNCQSQGEKDRYNRLLVRCDDAGLTLVREGLAFVFSVDGPAPKEWQDAQAEARANKRGMWAKGTPTHIVSSLHSASESKEGEPTYNRVVDARTGHAEQRQHSDAYEVCQEVCVGEGADASCMVYVPFERRYKDRASCLQ